MKKSILGLIVLGTSTVLALAEPPLPPMPPAIPSGTRQPQYVSSSVMAAAGVYNGLIAADSVKSMEAMGGFALKLTTNGSFSGTLSLSRGNVAFSGRFNASGVADLRIRNPFSGQDRLVLSLILDTTNHSGLLTGSIKGLPSTLNVRAVRSMDLAKTNRAGDQRFTFLISPLMSPEGTPISGYGYGVGSVASTGTATISGCMGDGCPFTQTLSLSKEGEWPFGVIFTAGRESRSATGMVQGWLTVSNGIPSGTLTWIVPARTNANYYAAGFTNTVTATGHTYNTEAWDQSGLRMAHPEIILSGGELKKPLVIPVTYTGKGNAMTNASHRLKLDFYRSSGLLTGVIASPVDPQKTFVLKGVLTQPSHNAIGYFSANGSTGCFILQEAGAARK